MANEYLKRTPTSTGNRKVFTWAAWLKKNEIDTSFGRLFEVGADTSNRSYFTFRDGDEIEFVHRDAGSNTDQVISDYEFKDPGSFAHFMIAANSTASTETDRIKIYVNGVLLTGYSTSNFPAINQKFDVNRLVGHYLGNSVNQAADLMGVMSDVFFVDGQALTPEVFGFHKDGYGSVSVGSTTTNDFRNGQWVPRNPREIKNSINATGGFGVNGFYLPMNDSSNFGADFHTTPNSIITLKGENLPQPRNGAPDTTDAYVSQLRTDPYAANLVLAVPGISTATGANLITNGNFDTSTSGWTLASATGTLVAANGELEIQRVSTNGTHCYQAITTEIGRRYTVSFDTRSSQSGASYVTKFQVGTSINGQELLSRIDTDSTTMVHHTASFTATGTTAYVTLGSNYTANSFWDNIVVKQEDAPRDYSADIKGSGTNKTLTPNGAAGVGYEIPSYYGSAMTFDGSGDYFSRTYDADFNFGTSDFTVEMWVYPNTVSSIDGLFAVSGGSGSNPKMAFHLNNGTPSVHYNVLTGGANIYTASGTAIPAGQWSHLAYERKGSTWTWYVNGVATGTGSNSTDITFTNQPMYIGYGGEAYFDSLDGKIQDVRVYKGIAKYKGGFDVPKPYTPVGIESWRQSPVSCKDNFATLTNLSKNPTVMSGGRGTIALSEANLTSEVNGVTGDNKEVIGNISVRSGKWYYEATFELGASGATVNSDGAGWVCDNGFGYNGTTAGGFCIIARDNGATVIGNASSRHDDAQDTFERFGIGDVLGCAIDLETRVASYYLNGNLHGFSYNFSGRSDLNDQDFSPFILNRTQPGKVRVNFGQNPTFSGAFTTAGTYTDSNGKGLFKYQPPEGFLALCGSNLETPIDDPSKHFQSVVYDGTALVGNKITGLKFKPDLVWIKSRQGGVANSWHSVNDSVRDARMWSNDTSAEDTFRDVMSYDDNGFSVNYGSYVNNNGGSYVAWCWKGGGDAVKNNDGTIESRISANPTAGFSIVTWTGNGIGSQTIGHGLGKAPDFYIWKSRDNARDWHIAHKDLTAYNYTLYFTSAMEVNNDKIYQAPSSTVIYPAASNVINGISEKYVGYFWTEIEGYSKFGSYTGNGNADGPFVYCGFKPAFLMIKITSPSGQERDWHIYDSTREPTNPLGYNLRPSSSVEENNEPGLDFLSNGFKVRSTYTFSNYNTGKFIFVAFAESPFKYANAK